MVIASAVFLAACYDDNGDRTSSGSNNPPSTNNLAPNTIVNLSFTLQYSSGPLAATTEVLRLRPAQIFERIPSISLGGFQSSGNYVIPVLSSSGNVWTTQLNTTQTNGVSANFSEILVLTFIASNSGTFTLTGVNANNAGTFVTQAIASRERPNNPSFRRKIFGPVLATILSTQNQRFCVDQSTSQH